MEPLRRAAAQSEDAYQAALVDVRRLERCLETETARSLRCRESKHKMKVENDLLLEENQLLRRTVADLEADRGPSFDDGYFTATYEVLQGLPADFDLHAAFGWSREQILARAGELASPDRTNPPQEPGLPNEVILVDEDDVQAGSKDQGAGGAGAGIQEDTEASRRDEGVIVQEDV